MDRPRFGVGLAQGWRSDLPPAPPAEQWAFLQQQAVRAESLGYHSIWLVDHFNPAVDPDMSFFECWSATAALAAATSRVRLGQMATCNAYRSPPVLAKMAACIDAISGGRIDLGLGAGWLRHEFDAWGYDFPASPAVLIDRLDEAVQVILALWAGEPVFFHGAHYRVDGAQLVPRPVQEPHPPLWIAGQGERRTLRLVAERADWCNLLGSPETVARKLDVLWGHCAAIGRDPDTIGVSWKGDLVVGRTDAAVDAQAVRAREFWARRGFAEYADYAGHRAAHLVGTPDQVRARIGEYRALGCEYFVCDFWDVEGEAMELFAEAVADVD